MMWGPRRTSTGNSQTNQTQQLAAITRLGMVLRADWDLEHIFSALVDAINSTLGFNCAALNLVRSEGTHVEVVALAGLSPADGQRLMDNPPSLQALLSAMDKRFQIGRYSYFISHRNTQVLDGIPGVTSRRSGPTPSAPDAWHPDDVLLVKLNSPRDQTMLAILSLDEPASGKIPTDDVIEMVELFADQAALAIETSLLFQEREYRETSLRQGIAALIATLDEVRQGNLNARAAAQDPALMPLAQSLNTVVGALEGILGELREAGTTVANNAGSVRAIATHLAGQTSQRQDRMLEVSQEVKFMAESVRQIAETARDASIAAIHAIDRSNNGRVSAENAASGMETVQEVTLQSAKKVQRLREGIQEIGALAQTVTEYAQQTNLLTINATIQAMRAAEDGGRGFAVIAREIRDLAANTASAAKQISSLLQRVQAEAQQMESFITQSADQVEHQSLLATEAGAAMDEVDTATHQITQSIRRISDTATTQANAAETIAKATAEIAERTREDRQSVERMHTAMDHLAGLSDGLLRQVAFFRGTHEALDPIGAASSRPGAAPVFHATGPTGQMPTQPPPPSTTTFTGRPPTMLPRNMPIDGAASLPTGQAPALGIGDLPGTISETTGPVPVPPWLRTERDVLGATNPPPPTNPQLDRGGMLGGAATMTNMTNMGLGTNPGMGRGPAAPRLVPLNDAAPPLATTPPAGVPIAGVPIAPTAAPAFPASAPSSEPTWRPPTMNATPDIAPGVAPGVAPDTTPNVITASTLPPMPAPVSGTLQPTPGDQLRTPGEVDAEPRAEEHPEEGSEDVTDGTPTPVTPSSSGESSANASPPADD